MTLRRSLLLVLLAIAIAFVPARASAPIYQALTYIRNLDSGSFSNLTTWARKGGGKPIVVFSAFERAAASVEGLPYGQRNAIVQWLAGRGRGGLYAIGVNDSDIGPRRPGADLAMATPDPWRPLKFATSTLGDAAPDDSGITILNGFGAASKDGKQLMACISFKNTSPKTVSRVAFLFRIVGDSGARLGDFSLDRTGTFSTGVDINSFNGYEEWRSGKQHRGYQENCKSESQGMAAVPVLEARFIVPQVISVNYADGSAWFSNSLIQH